MKAYHGYFAPDGYFCSEEKILEFREGDYMIVIPWREPRHIGNIPKTSRKNEQERMESWKRLQELRLSVPADFDEKKVLAEARDKKYECID
jgi:hypothetical protein